MKTLTKLLIPILAGAFSFNSYGQKTEKTEEGFRQYNEKNQLIKEVSEDKNNKFMENYKYDENGNKTESIYKIDNENDGKFDKLIQINHKYNKNRNKIKKIEKTDKENDGKFDYIEQYDYKYNEDGKLIKTEIMKDNNADGEFDEYEEY